MFILSLPILCTHFRKIVDKLNKTEEKEAQQRLNENQREKSTDFIVDATETKKLAEWHWLHPDD